MLYRTLFICCLLLCLSALPVWGRELFFGLKAGLNAASRSYDSPVESGGRLGFTGGISLTNGFTDVVGMRLELLYSMKGDRIAEERNGVRYESTLTIHTVDIPVVAIARLPAVLGVRPNVFAGPVLSMVFDSSTEGTFPASSVHPHTFPLKTLDVGATVGGGIAFLWGPAILGVDARYTFGLLSTVESPGSTEPVSVPTVTNGVFSIMAGYFFRL